MSRTPPENSYYAIIVPVGITGAYFERMATRMREFLPPEVKCMFFPSDFEIRHLSGPEVIKIIEDAGMTAEDVVKAIQSKEEPNADRG